MALCKQCSKLDFSAYRVRKQHEEDDFIQTRLKTYSVGEVTGDYDYGVSGTEEPLHMSHSENTLQSETITSSKAMEIENLKKNQRRVASDILKCRDSCQLCTIVAHHMEKNNVGPDATIEMYTSRFCSTTDKNRRNRQTVRLKVLEVIETTPSMMGPLEAYQIADIVESHCILELQECCSPVPSTADYDSSVPQILTRDTDRRFSGRLISPKADLKLFSRWIKLCGQQHGESCCQPIFSGHSTESLKSFLVIDVEHMCIVGAPAQCRYAALSYCWGRAPMLKHLLENSARLQMHGALADADMPATIADAIELVRGVGERYLWVDALCIIQDDPISQKVQLSQMGLVYSLAAFTIVAAFGEDANAGLPGLRPDTRKMDQRILQVGEKTLLEVVDGDDYYGGIKKSNWNTRAWTMQEKLLSKRLLIFTEQQVYWSCWNAVWLEEVVLEDVLNIDFQRDPIKTGPEDVGFSLIDQSGDTNTEQLYYLLVNAYRERQLSFKSDILNAFSGLCQALSTIQSESFHWGLPVSSFDEWLGWSLRGHGTRNHALCDPNGTNQFSPSVPFPSWSWAAWHGTSGHSWIYWRSHMSHSEKGAVKFFHYDKEGRLEQIIQSPSKQTVNQQNSVVDTQDEAVTDVLRRPWICEPQTISDKNDAPTSTQIGLLHFWTSTATLSIRREANRGGSPPVSNTIVGCSDFSRPFLSMDTWDYALHIGEDVENIDEGTPAYEILEREFVVIGMHEESELTALAVEWKDGIAYRIGVMVMKESLWVSLKNRVWKRVVLG